MCLILFAVQPTDQCQLLVAANRDEQHARPSLKADFWEDDSNILGGRDLSAGGTWLGITRTGRFAAVTNFAETPPDPMPPRSRGDLTRHFLASQVDCQTYLEQVDKDRHLYRGFNLIISDGKQVYYYGNRDPVIRVLEAGYYGLSNQLLDCDWPKVAAGRRGLENLESKDFPIDAMFELLSVKGDETAHSARFILGENYGTCASTVVKMAANEISFTEKSFDAAGNVSARKHYDIEMIANVT